jgi:hypothetical protein
MELYFFLILSPIIVILIAVLINYNHKRKVNENSVYTEATITKIFAMSSDDGSDGGPYVVYCGYTVDGVDYEAPFSSGYREPSLSVGDKVKILYQKDKPKRAIPYVDINSK